MKKKILSIILAITFCSTPIINNNTLTTEVYASDNIRINVALNNQTKGGSYNITITDESYNSVTKTIPTSGSFAYFEDISRDKEYFITVTHTSNDKLLYYYGKHSFVNSEYGESIYLNVTDTPIENHTFTKNSTTIVTENSQITVAGAYANINSTNNIYANYISPFISTDFKLQNILETVSLNGYITGDEYAILNFEMYDDLPDYFAVAVFDRYNTIQSIYYNTNSFPITKWSDNAFSLYLTNFSDTTNIALIELDSQNEINYNFTTFDSTLNYKNIESSYNNKAYSTTNHITTGSIPTTGYIQAFRNVSIGDTINLDSLNIPGVTQWYYDIVYKNPVYNTSEVVITKDILTNGLYPKYDSSASYRNYVFIK